MGRMSGHVIFIRMIVSFVMCIFTITLHRIFIGPVNSMEVSLKWFDCMGYRKKTTDHTGFLLKLFTYIAIRFLWLYSITLYRQCNIDLPNFNMVRQFPCESLKNENQIKIIKMSYSNLSSKLARSCFIFFLR